MQQSIHAKIRKTRLSRKFSQQYMADKLGINQSYYNKLENGKKILNLHHIQQIAVILDIEITELFGSNSNKSA